jgi:hypothetical protein
MSCYVTPGTPASTITKTGHHDIAEILLKMALKHQKSNQSIRNRLKSVDFLSAI